MWYNIIRGLETAPKHGGVAQLGERCVRNAEVMGSSPTISTNNKRDGFSRPFYYW